MTAPERICLLPDDGWSWVEGPKPPYDKNAIEYIRADLAAVQPMHGVWNKCTFDLSGAGYDCAIKDGDARHGAYGEDQKVFWDGTTINADGLYILSKLALDKRIAAVQPAQVRVKPLVWEEPCYTNNWIHVARSVLGDYYISIDGGRHSAWLEANVKPYENKIGDDVGSAIEAMMMAETDYQARMQPLITPHPDPRDDVIARLTDMTANMDAMRNFIADFAAFKFDACYQNHASRPEDDGDDVTDAEPVWSWQEDARALIAQDANP